MQSTTLNSNSDIAFRATYLHGFFQQALLGHIAAIALIIALLESLLCCYKTDKTLTLQYAIEARDQFSKHAS